MLNDSWLWSSLLNPSIALLIAVISGQSSHSRLVLPLATQEAVFLQVASVLAQPPGPVAPPPLEEAWPNVPVIENVLPAKQVLLHFKVSPLPVSRLKFIDPT